MNPRHRAKPRLLFESIIRGPIMKKNSWALIPLIIVNSLSLFGFATFASNPDYLKKFPWAEPIFEISYPLFSRLQILLAVSAMIYVLWNQCSKVWMKAFVAIIITSLTSELAGTSVGIPFGAYGYSSLLGFKILGKVPALIPLSWFYMSIASYDLVSQRSKSNRFSLFRVTLSSLVLLVWDLVLDPAMSHLTPFWLWENPGGFFGMPTSNLVGWFITGFFLMLWLEILKAHEWLKALPQYFSRNFYLSNLMLPLGMCLISQLWTPVLLSLGALLPIILSTEDFKKLKHFQKEALA